MYRHNPNLGNIIARTVCAFALASTISVAQSLAANATLHYVSKNGPATGDGLSWAKAWPELNKIDWSLIHPGDVILIDGGQASMVYNTSLIVPPSVTEPAGPQPSGAPNAVWIMNANTPGRNGQIILDGTSAKTPYGIDMQGSCTISGAIWNRNTRTWQWHGIRIQNFPKAGVHCSYNGFSPNYGQPAFCCVDVGTNGQGKNSCGVILEQPAGYFSSEIYNNAVNIYESTNCSHALIPQTYSGIINCWIYNNNASLTSAGIQVKPNLNAAATAAPSSVFVTGNVLGPGLFTGLDCGNQTVNYVANTLFENASQNNMLLEPTSSLMAGQVTSFMTPLNAQNQAHSCLTLQTKNAIGGLSYPNLNLFNSIFFGGVVSAPAGLANNANQGNVQFNTRGNTNYLSYQGEVNPQFETNVSLIPNNVSFKAMENTSFIPNPYGPAHDAGSSVSEGSGFTPVTSVASVLATQPVVVPDFLP